MRQFIYTLSHELKWSAEHTFVSDAVRIKNQNLYMEEKFCVRCFDCNSIFCFVHEKKIKQD